MNPKLLNSDNVRVTAQALQTNIEGWDPHGGDYWVNFMIYKCYKKYYNLDV